MVVLADGDRALAFERADVPNSFQLPQGGLEDGEEPIDAMWRELLEETGLTPAHVTVVAELPEWLGYELPPPARTKKTGRGQVHKWFVLRATSQGLPIVLGDVGRAEFRSWRWVDLGELADEVVPFRRSVYRRLAEIVRQGLQTSPRQLRGEAE
jgi:putative (di)nucleoside polyphosphate hydrolase